VSETTPGPWLAKKGEYGGYNVVRASDGCSIASASEYPYFCIEDEADARLMASAPDLAARAARLEAALRGAIAALEDTAAQARLAVRQFSPTHKYAWFDGEVRAVADPAIAAARAALEPGAEKGTK
jgi:hypothetical protein